MLLSDGTWGDPCREISAGISTISRTQIDPPVRAMVICHGLHAWVFSTAGLSADIAVGTADLLAHDRRYGNVQPPAVLFAAGPHGDLNTIWSADTENVRQMPVHRIARGRF